MIRSDDPFSDPRHSQNVISIALIAPYPVEDLAQGESPVVSWCYLIMKTAHLIRKLVSKALSIKQLTPDIENEINCELTRLGYISDVDYEALELLMSEMDAGRIRLVANP
jgi:hypothetical protein